MPRLHPLLPACSACCSPRPRPSRPRLPPWGTGESQGEDLAISLVTFSPGDDVASWWGHGSLVVEDRRLEQSRLYNYGMFSFDERMLRALRDGTARVLGGRREPRGDLTASTARYNRDVRHAGART